MLVPQKWENKNAPIELETQSDFFLLFSLKFVTQKRKNKSLTIELVTWSEIKYFFMS